MTTTTRTLRATYPRVFRAFGQWRRPVAALGGIGDHTLFYGKSMAGIPFAVTRYRREIVRLIAEISMGAGTLAMIGGTVVIVGFLTLAAGGTLAVQGYSSLGNIGIEALTGFLTAFINVRIAAPVVAGIGLAVILSFLASQFTTVVLFGQSGGLYHHYFDTFLNPIDLLWSFLQAVLMALAVLLLHTYYGYFASGGPEGVGVATGNAVRTSLIVVVSVTLLISLSVYGTNGNFNLSG